MFSCCKVFFRFLFKGPRGNNGLPGRVGCKLIFSFFYTKKNNHFSLFYKIPAYLALLVTLVKSVYQVKRYSFLEINDIDLFFCLGLPGDASYIGPQGKIDFLIILNVLFIFFII